MANPDGLPERVSVPTASPFSACLSPPNGHPIVAEALPRQPKSQTMLNETNRPKKKKKKKRPAKGDQTEGINTLSQLDTSKLGKKLVKEERHLSQLRASAISTRLQVDKERQKFGQIVDQILALEATFLELSSSFWSSEDYPTRAPPRLQAVHDELANANRVLREIADEGRRLDHRLSSVQFEINEKEPAFVDCVKDALNGIVPNFAASISNQSPSSRRRGRGKETPPLLRDYYDKAADVTILQDRLMEVERDHLDAKMERELRRASGEPVFPPETDFIDEFHRLLAMSAHELAIAEEKAEMLRQECLDNHLDPDRSLDETLVTSLENHRRRAVSDHQQRKPRHIGVLPGSYRSPFFLQFAYSSTRDRINQWLTELYKKTGIGRVQSPLDGSSPVSETYTDGDSIFRRVKSFPSVQSDSSSQHSLPKPARIKSWYGEKIEKCWTAPSTTNGLRGRIISEV
jgi:hypothetical protein